MDFWKKWKKVTKLEKEAIKTLLAGKRIILSSIPKKEIVSIYVKGSLVRRELTQRSDVDFVVILKTKKYINRLITLEKKYRDTFRPSLEIRGYSLWELKTGKRLKVKSSMTPPSKFTRHLPNFGRIYGKDLFRENLFMREDLQELKGSIKFLSSYFMPQYEANKIGLQMLIKQVFWLTDLELKLRGNHPPHSWTGMAKLAPKNHIIHTVLKLRKANAKHDAHFIAKLKKYLSNLKREFNA